MTLIWLYVFDVKGYTKEKPLSAKKWHVHMIRYDTYDEIYSKINPCIRTKAHSDSCMSKHESLLAVETLDCEAYAVVAECLAGTMMILCTYQKEAVIKD